MTAAGQLIPVSVLPLVRLRDSGHESMAPMGQSKSRRPRIYRIPRPDYRVTDGIYGADGRMSYVGAVGEKIDLLA